MIVHDPASALKASDLLFASAATAPDHPCLTFEAQTWSYADAVDAVKECAATLRDAGVGVGEVVVVCLDNGPTAVATLLGGWAAGAVCAPINPLLAERERALVVSRLAPAAVVSTQVDQWASVAPSSALVEAGSTSNIRAHHEGRGTRLPDDAALILHTSGTTGTPKAVIQTHGALLGSVESVMRLLGVGGGPSAVPRPGAPNLIAFPLSHLAGIFNLLLALRNQREVLLMRRFSVEEFMALMERYRLPSVILNPTMIHMLVEDEAVTVERLQPLRFVRSGSAPLPASLATRFYERFGIPVLNAYGQTETAGEVIGWNAGDVRQYAGTKLGSVGRPHPGVELRFLDEDGASVGQGEVGELCVRSSTVLRSYVNGDEPDLVDGFLRTGDLGKLDDDGFVWLVGRRNDVINRGGFKVLPEEVEEVLRAVPGVADVMVAGIEDERLGEVPHAFVVATAGAPDDLDEQLRVVAAGRLAKYKVPVAIHRVAELPRNALGKVLRTQAVTLIPSKETT